MNRVTIAGCLAAVLSLPPASAQRTDTQPAPQSRPAGSRPVDPKARAARDAIKQRMQARYEQLERLRDAGKVGENSQGLAEVVKPEFADESVDPRDRNRETIRALVSVENDDRRDLYDLLAKHLHVTAAEVGRQNAVRLLEKADPDHWLKLESGRWVQRKDVRKDEQRR